MIKRQQVKKAEVCDLQGCQNKAVISRKVQLLEGIDDYELAMNLCPRHKNHFKQGEALLGLDLKAFGKEALLGESKDKDKQRIANETLEYMRKQAKSNNREESVEILINAAKHFTKVADGKFLVRKDKRRTEDHKSEDNAISINENAGEDKPIIEYRPPDFREW